MSLDPDPLPILEDSNEDTELRKLLAAAQTDGPSASQMSAMAQGLGIHWTLSAGSDSVDPNISVNAHAASGSSGVSVLTKTHAGLGLRWVITGVVAVLGTIAAWQWGHQSPETRDNSRLKEGRMEQAHEQDLASSSQLMDKPLTAASDVTPRLKTDAQESRGVTLSPRMPQRELQASPKIVRRSSDDEGSRSTTSQVIPSIIDTRAEFLLIQRAQSLLARAPRRSLQLVKQHETTFPRGELVPEREMIAIEALWSSEQREAAVARARQFLRQFPHSNYQNRVRQLLSEVEP